MDESIQADLLAAHVEALIRSEEDYHDRYSALFPEEMKALGPLFELAERLQGLFREPVTMRADFRADLKQGLLAEARQQKASRMRGNWHWAAIGASAMTVAGVIAAAAWRGSQNRASR